MAHTQAEGDGREGEMGRWGGVVRWGWRGHHDLQDRNLLRDTPRTLTYESMVGMEGEGN